MNAPECDTCARQNPPGGLLKTTDPGLDETFLVCRNRAGCRQARIANAEAWARAQAAQREGGAA